jgi:hypothetical protein
MVMTMSAAWTFPVVSGLGNSAEISRPISAMAATTAGLSPRAGSEPAEVTRTRPAACWFSSAAAIWDRPALWVQTNSTSGMPSITHAPFLFSQPGGCVHAAGLTARMMAECMPGAASWVNVTDAPAKPAAVRPSRYSERESAPAMQPT